ncbi:MAG TPA: amidase family protein [Solirubrobacter sp.]
MEIFELGAARQAALIRSRELSSREVVEAQLARIAAVNDDFGALRVVLAEQALAAADAADREPATGPLHGVPVSVKENIDVAGTATTWGTQALRQAVAPLDAPVVANLKAAGAIVLARGTLPDFALRWHTEGVVNPVDPTRTAGGSSAGEAVAVATGMVALGVGNDLGGSLRFPSQCCGTVALRPTLGRVPDAGVIPTADVPLSRQLFNAQGPIAREVDDLRLALAAMSAPSARDPWSVPAALLDGPRRVRVAFPPDAEPGVEADVRAAADALADAGWEVDEGMPPAIDEAAQLWLELLMHDVRRDWPQMEPIASEGARRFMTQALAAAPPPSPDAWTARRRIAREWAEHDGIYLTPICLREPFAPGADLEEIEAVLASMRMVVPVNLLGLPAVAASGIQLIGPRFGEALCLAAGTDVQFSVASNTADRRSSTV